MFLQKYKRNVKEHKSHLTPITDFSNWFLLDLDVPSPNVGGLDP